MGEPEPHCRDCKFWVAEKKPYEGVLFGECRRHAPLNIPIKRHREWRTTAFRPVWPFTGEREWCGEYEGRGASVLGRATE